MTDKKKIVDQDESGLSSEVNDQAANPDDQHEETDSGKGKEEPKGHKEGHKAKKDKDHERIAQLEQSILEMTDKYLRLQAEFDNFRKRTLKEKAELIKSGGDYVLSNILPIIDDFDRALGTMKEVAEDDPAKIGFLLIFSKFKEFMRQHNVREIEAVGMDFNVNEHYALTKIPAASEEQKGKIVDVVEKGYMLNDKVLRYAKVVIGE